MPHTRFDLTGKTVLVTGASSGIGRAIAVMASECGAGLLISGRDDGRLKQTLNALAGKNHRIIKADLSEDSGIDDLVKEIPIINGLVHCAGITAPVPVRFVRSKHIDAMMRTNYHAPVLLTTLALHARKIADGGSVVFLSSIATRFPYFGGSMYISSKSALSGFSMVMALEMAGRKIRSNCLLPGFVDTPMYQATRSHASPEAMQKFEMLHPLGIGKPEDVAGPACFLLSDASSWITGVNIPLGGSL